MENASKALIIAGAVLISIVLISLGVMLISRSGNASGSAENTSQMIDEQSQTGINTISNLTTNLFKY